MKKDKKSISPSALDLLLSHAWPGNIRELENTIERSLILCEGDTIEKEHIWIAPPVRSEKGTPDGTQPLTLKEAKQRVIEEAERAMIQRVLTECGGNKSKAARKLKVSYRVLLKKVKDYEIQFTPFLQSD